MNSETLNAHNLIWTTGSNIWAGIKAVFFRRNSFENENATWTQLVVLVVAGLLLHFFIDFIPIGVNGNFSSYGLHSLLLQLPILTFIAWLIAIVAKQTNKTLQLLIVFYSTNLFFIPLYPLLQWIGITQLLSEQILSNFYWVVLPLWYAIANGRAAVQLLDSSKIRKTIVVLLTIVLVTLWFFKFNQNNSLWIKPYDQNSAAAWHKKRNILTNEDVYYSQSKLLEQSLANITVGATAATNLYFIGVAGDSEQDVFMREIQSISQQFKDKYGTLGRSIELINNAQTVLKYPIASVTSLRQSLMRFGQVMNPEKDILFLYMTSHGSEDAKFVLDFGAMTFNDMNPVVLRKILDESGIKNRVIVISACYSGSFIKALSNDDTLIITSAAPDKTSFGCSNEENFTYFGNAYFDQALRKTDSFIDAFDIARPLITAREKQGNYTNSDPRIFVGSKIKNVIAQFSQQVSTAHKVDNIIQTSVGVPAKMKLGSLDRNQLNGAENMQAAGKLVDLLGYDRFLKGAKENCLAAAKLQSPDVLYRTKPNHFRGITPQSKYWPKVVEAYQKYYSEQCHDYDVGKLKQDLTVYYLTTYDADQLSQLSRFYTSALGKKFIDSNSEISNLLQNELNAQALESNDLAQIHYDERLLKLIALEAQEQRNARPWWQFWKS